MDRIGETMLPGTASRLSNVSLEGNEGLVTFNKATS